MWQAWNQNDLSSQYNRGTCHGADQGWHFSTALCSCQAHSGFPQVSSLQSMQRCVPLWVVPLALCLFISQSSLQLAPRVHYSTLKLICFSAPRSFQWPFLSLSVPLNIPHYLSYLSICLSTIFPCHLVFPSLPHVLFNSQRTSWPRPYQSVVSPCGSQDARNALCALEHPLWHY